jgi:CBS domain-containing protein
MVLDLPSGRIARPIVTVEEDGSVFEAARIMVDNNRGSIVVVTKDGKTAGVLTERDIMKRVVAKSKNPTTTKVKEVMTKELITIEKTKPLREAIDLMNRKHLRRMLVTENGSVVGIFTLRDIVTHTRVCMYCGKEIMSILESPQPDPYLECQCGSRYHKGCAETVVHCVTCSTTLVTNVIYPEPSETTGG